MSFMRKIRFLLEMKEKEKLEMVEPSDDISQSYLEKSASHMDSAKILLSAGKIEESVSMAYYGMYHCLLALLFRCGIKSENHSASIILLKELFSKDNLSGEISFAKKERIDKQYYVDFELSKNDAEDLVKKAESFITSCKVIIKRLNNGKIEKLRKELEEALQ